MVKNLQTENETKRRVLQHPPQFGKRPQIPLKERHGPKTTSDLIENGSVRYFIILKYVLVTTVFCLGKQF